jgi:hypothetical protein
LRGEFDHDTSAGEFKIEGLLGIERPPIGGGRGRK